MISVLHKHPLLQKIAATIRLDNLGAKIPHFGKEMCNTI